MGRVEKGSEQISSGWDFHTHRPDGPRSIVNRTWENPPESGYFSLGLHPWFLDKDWELAFDLVRFQARQNERVLAIGECGFDRLKGPYSSIQKAAFRAQAQLATELGIPLMLHCVKGHDLLLEFLRSSADPPSIVWHGWNLRPELAVSLLPFPVYFSFGRHLAIPDSNAGQSLRQFPCDRIFFETDDSDVEIDTVYQSASLILGRSTEDLAKQVISNWNKISKRKIK
jgi:TatD DNase family protein